MPVDEPLRQRLLDVASDLLMSSGPEAVTIRETARRAGVSHGAPRRHFATRQVLLATLAAGGFDDLNAQVDRALSAAEKPEDRLHRACEVYVDFAVRNRSLFDLMFRHDLLADSGIRLRERSLGLLDRFGVLLGEVAGRPAYRAQVVETWAALHGLAVLGANRSLELASPDVDARALIGPMMARATRREAP